MTAKNKRVLVYLLTPNNKRAAPMRNRPFSCILRSICPELRVTFVQETIKNDQFVPNCPAHLLKLNNP